MGPRLAVNVCLAQSMTLYHQENLDLIAFKMAFKRTQGGWSGREKGREIRGEQQKGVSAATAWRLQLLEAYQSP